MSDPNPYLSKPESPQGGASDPYGGPPPAPPQYAQPGYPPAPNPYQSPSPYGGSDPSAKQPTSGLAIAGLVLGALGFLLFFLGLGFLGIIGFVLSLIALGGTGRNKKGGRALAVWGAVLGGIATICCIVAVILIFAVGGRFYDEVDSNGDGTITQDEIDQWVEERAPSDTGAAGPASLLRA